MSSTESEIVLVYNTPTGSGEMEFSKSFLTPSGNVQISEDSISNPMKKLNVSHNTETQNLSPQDLTATEKEEIKISVVIKDYILVLDELFYIEKENDMFYLNHPRWSLVGMGETFSQAFDDLRIEAKELFNKIKDDKAIDLSHDALSMRDFLYKFI